MQRGSKLAHQETRRNNQMAIFEDLEGPKTLEHKTCAWRKMTLNVAWRADLLTGSPKKTTPCDYYSNPLNLHLVSNLSVTAL